MSRFKAGDRVIVTYDNPMYKGKTATVTRTEYDGGVERVYVIFDGERSEKSGRESSFEFEHLMVEYRDLEFPNKGKVTFKIT